MSPLDDALDRLAALPRLLVALDFDGVLAPLVDDPSTSRPLPGSADAVRRLSAHPRTTVVLLSGRGRDDLAAVSGFGPPVHLVGSHGAEFDAELSALLGGRGGLLTAAQTIAYARTIVAQAHAVGLAVGQKNLASWDGRRVGFDFAVVEQCGEFHECAAYARTYGDRVLSSWSPATWLAPSCWPSSPPGTAANSSPNAMPRTWPRRTTANTTCSR